ncbi:MAG: ImmA/IrrE family metallo-endopeptidase [Polyangiaceae bacterium]
MARPRYALAKQEADRLLERAGIRFAPVDVDHLATEVLGAVLRTGAFDGEMDGVLIREPGQTPIIGVNDKLSDVRRRFTVAHELGHLVLHSSPYHVDTKIHMRNSLSSTAESVVEIEANQFAANLLMPDWMLNASLEEEPAQDLEDRTPALAVAYGVSVQAMTLRLAKLLKHGL